MGIEGWSFDVTQEAIEVIVILEAVFKCDVVDEVSVMQLGADCNSISPS